jgi:hypothetical protein
MIAAALIFSSIGFLPLMPYTMENFQPWLYYAVVPFQLIMITFILAVLWRKIVGPGNT